MDACKYKSITGFDNWEGVKLLLKNSSAFSQFNISDDSINLKIVYQYAASRLKAAPVNFSQNEFAVVINCISSGYSSYNISSTSFGAFSCSNTNSENVLLYNNDALGAVICEYLEYLDVGGDSQTSSIMIAVFSCF
jgi:hypothetical protein